MQSTVSPTAHAYRSTTAPMVGLSIAALIYVIATISPVSVLLEVAALDPGTVEHAGRLLQRLEFDFVAQALLAGLVSPALPVFFAIWFMRTNRNARALGNEHLQYKPWSWLWLFAPLYGLWVGYESVQELWMSTSRGIDDLKAKPPLLTAWWASLVLSGCFNWAGMTWLEPFAQAGESMAGVTALLLARILLGVSLFCMWHTIREIHREQSLQARAMQLI